MTNDPVNYVRQGALISSALIMIQQTEITCPKVSQFRQLYSKVINDKHDDVMARFSAILAQGVLDAGGHNVTISLQSENPARVKPAQLKVLSMPEGTRYQPFKLLSIGGIIILQDTSEEEEQLVEPVAAHGPKIEEEEQEPEPPEPFEYIDD
ncbi:26S proteasome non-ATPase regulatory subunit 1 [Pelobates cultripes]|uniref:26S proteasome non-ATPase regulatory subunit 1 n=1 Tax=Pelobates cultripes TaxID=61616 RepID=A0AAD1RSY5_PELCU|nr:26S proteasome non-ATPase regulatory subunit 1 [Pelobates cultripes]